MNGSLPDFEALAREHWQGYPPDFGAWSLEWRNAYFGAASRLLRENKARSARPFKASKSNGLSHSRNSQDSQASGSENREPPRPLRREISPAEPFPLEALGDVLGGAARAILDKVRCPDAIAANSVLAAASLAIQAHADVVLPATGHPRPLSLFLATVTDRFPRFLRQK